MMIEAADNYVTIELPTCSLLMVSQLESGIKLQLRIIFRPFAGNELFFYDQNLRLIQDPLSLYEAGTIIYSNIRKLPDEPFEGIELLNKEIVIHGQPTCHNYLSLETTSGSYQFRDQYSLFTWDRTVDPQTIVKAYIQ